MIWLFVGIAVLLASAIGYLLYLCLLISKTCLTIPFPASRHEPPEQNEETVFLKTLDGSKSEGRWIPSRKKSDKTVIFCHELGADLNSWHKYAYFLPENNFNVLSFNFRNLHTKHDGVYQLSSGQWATRSDVDDILAALRYLKTERSDFSGKIGVLGISKGANAALSALRHTCEIDAIVTDGAFSSVETVLEYIKKWVNIYVPIQWLTAATPDWFYKMLAYIGLWIAGLKLGCRFVAIECALKKTKVPIMFIHGEKDPYISPKHASFLFHKTSSVEELWIVPGARHNEAVRVNPDEYEEKVVSFLKGAMA